jgi:hypothetical protein
MLPNELGPLARPSDLMYQQSRMLSRRYDRIDVLVEVDVCVSNGSTTNACCWVGWLSECGADLLLESTRITNHLIECCCCCLAGCCLAGCCQLLVMLMCCLLDRVLLLLLAQAQLFKSKATDTKTLRNTFKFLESIVSAVQLFGAKLDVYVYLPDRRQHWCLC